MEERGSAHSCAAITLCCSPVCRRSAAATIVRPAAALVFALVALRDPQSHIDAATRAQVHRWAVAAMCAGLVGAASVSAVLDDASSLALVGADPDAEAPPAIAAA